MHITNLDHATDATAGIGIMQFFIGLPEINTWLQTLFFIVSIIWVVTQIYHKWQGK